MKTYLDFNSWKGANITVVGTTELNIKSRVDYEGEVFINLSNEDYKELSQKSLEIIRIRLVNSLIPFARYYKNAVGNDKKTLDKEIDKINDNINAIYMCCGVIRKAFRL